MRQPTRRATRRARVQQSQDVGRYQVVAPSRVRTDGGGSALQLADTLNTFFRAAGPIVAEREQRREEAGIRDAQTGQVDPVMQERSERYRRSVARTQARAGWIQDEAEFDETIRSLQIDDLDPEEQAETLNRAIDELYAEKYQGLDDEDMAEFLLPQMEQFRAEKNAELVERQRAQLIEQQTANFQVIARDMAEAARAEAMQGNPGAEPFETSASGSFDYHGLHDEIAAQFEGGEINAIYFEVLKDIAVRTGDPELLRNIPERWNDGQRTLTGIPSYNEKLLNAEMRAEQQRASLQKAETKANEAALEAEIDRVELQTAMGILSGREPGEGIAELAELGADASKVLALQSAWRASRDDLEERAADPAAITGALGAAYQGQLGVVDVLQMFASGQLGRGPAAQQQAASMMNIVDEVARTRDRNLDQEISGFQSTLGRTYKDTGIVKNPALSRIEAKAREEYHIRAVRNGEDPLEAYQAVREKYDRAWELASGGNASQTAAERQNAAVQAFLSGEVSAEAVVETGVTADQLSEMYRTGALPGEYLDRILPLME